MGIIPLIAAIGATTGFAGILLGKSFATFNIDEKWEKLENYRDQIKQEFEEKKNRILQMKTELTPLNKYVVKYNTTIGSILTQKTCVPDIPNYQGYIRTKTKLAEQIKKEFALQDCQIVSITHISDYSDFEYLPAQKIEQESSEFSTVNERYRELVAA